MIEHLQVMTRGLFYAASYCVYYTLISCARTNDNSYACIATVARVTCSLSAGSGWEAGPPQIFNFFARSPR